MYLLDTNIFLEYILSRSRVDEVRDFFHRADLTALHISDLAFHSIGIILYQKNAPHLFSDFIEDLFGDGGITLFALGSEDIKRPEHVSLSFKLDFDDAYLSVVAEKFDLALVSFDTDFDRTDRKRIIPADIFEQ